MSAHVMANASNLMVFWRDRIFSLGEWADDAFGCFDYTAQNGQLVVDYELEPNGLAVEIVLHAINGALPPFGLPATELVGERMRLTPAKSLTPSTVPAAILLMISWAEWMSHGGEVSL